MYRRRSKTARRRASYHAVNKRAYEIEILETRWLLAIDLSTSAAGAVVADVANPTAIVYQPFGASEPNGTAGPTGKQPSQILHAYGFDQISFGAGVVGNGAGQTIAIVDAYDTPTIAHDLQAFDTAFGLPAPPSFVRVAQDGTTNYPSVDPRGAGVNNWEVETALDVEWVHALAPMANIVLVEASDNGLGLVSAVTYARTIPSVSVVSMSFGGSESFLNVDNIYTTPAGHIPITFVASTGDTGVPGGYPAFSPNVLAVGGTTLTLNSSNNITSETGWSGSGGGISQYETQPSYQNGVVTQSTVFRTTPDVSFDADPNTGASVYDSYNNGTTKPWSQIGGTSFAAPSWAALIAIADQGRTLNGLSTLDGHNGTLPAIYSLPSTDFHDITSGNNGDPAGPGYDLVTGRGSPIANLVVAGLVSTSTMTGTVYADANNNGVDDAGETGIAGVTVYDDLNNNGRLDPPAVSTISSTFSPALAIPDGTSNLTSTLAVGNLNGSIMDVNVNLTIHHARDSNLTVTLISPAGTSVPLISHNGGNGVNFINTTLDDQSATSISAGTATFTGSFRPTGSLATLIGQNPQGTWSLVVSDTVAGNSGVLDNWSLQILTPSEPSVTTDGSGNYSFGAVSAGVHHLREVTPSAFALLSPAGGVQNVPVAAGLNAMGQNFGLQASTVSGTVFLDSNQNGAEDPGEIPIPAVIYDDLNNNGVFDLTSTWPVSSLDVPKTIADQSTELSTTMVTGLAGAITDLNVNLTIHHTRDSNISVTLISPNGVYVPLLNHNGGTGANFINTTLDDQASLSLNTGTAPFTNTYRPASPLSAFNGLNPNGVWKLMVVDTVTGNTGTLDGWTLQFTTNAPEPVLQSSSGSYQTAPLNAGVHHLRSFLPSTMTQTSPAGGAYNVTVSAQTTITNDNFGYSSSILALAGGPYTINEGSPLTLNGSATGSSSDLNYNWDINGDGVYIDAQGANPTLTWSQLVALGVNNGPESFTVTLRVDDGAGAVALSPPTTLTVLNVAPTANAGGPYTINEGDSLSLVGSGVDPVDALTYSWDVNGDGVFGDAVGATPTLTWSQLVALGVNNGPAAINVFVRVDDGDGGVTVSSPTLLTVNNAPPQATLSGPATTLRGQTQTFLLGSADASPTDQAAGFSFAINWGDGSPVQTVTGASGTQVTHSFAVAGALLVSVTATDQDGGVSAAAVQGVQVAIASLQPNAQNAALSDLIWSGGAGVNQVQFTQIGPSTIRVSETMYNGVAVNNVQDFSGVTGRVIAIGGAGDDLLDASSLNTVSATLNGAAGNNTLYGGNGGDLLIGGSNGGEGQQGNNVIIAGNGDNTIYGNDLTARVKSSGGNNLIVGGTGHDVIYGNFGTNPINANNPTGDGGEGGQNLIVGGGGGDTIYASQIADGAEGGKGSILIAGSTTLNQSALLSILNEWTSADAASVKLASISGAPSGLDLNGANYLIPNSTVFDDGVVDQLFSDTNGKPDWLQYSFSQDTVNRAKATDTLTKLS